MTLIGSFLSGLFRTVIPIVKKSGTALGQELLKSGVGLANDVWRTGDLESAQKRRGKEFINKVSNRVSEHMFGSGYTSQLGVKRTQFKKTGRAGKTGKSKKGKKAKGKKKKTASKKKKPVKKKKKTKKRRAKTDIQDIFS